MCADGEGVLELFYIHTNAMMFRNIGLQGIDPYTSGIQIIDNLLTYQFLPYGGVYYIPDCMFNYRQTEDSTFHRRSVYQNYILNALMLYQQKTVLRGLFGAGRYAPCLSTPSCMRNAATRS